MDVDRGPYLMAGIDELHHLAGRVGVADLGDHAAGRVDPAEMHQRFLEMPGPLIAQARRRHGDLHRARNAVFDRVLDGHEIELAAELRHLQGEIGGECGRLAVARGAADEDAAMGRHADPGEQRGFGCRETEALQGHAGVEPVGIEHAGEQMIAVGLVGAALAAQRRDARRQRHLAAGADREALEGAPPVAGLRRALVLAMEQETGGLAAFLGRQRLGQGQLAVVDDGEDMAGAAAGLEHHVARPGRGCVLEQAFDPPGRRFARGRRRCGARRPPAFGDLFEGCGFLGHRGRDGAALAQRQQRRAQPGVGLVATRDQATPAGEHRADAPEPGVHRGDADQSVGIRGLWCVGAGTSTAPCK